MDGALLVTAFRLAFALGGILVIAAAAGALLASMFRVATQIDDPVFGFVARAAGVSLALFVGGARIAGEISQFAVQLWSGNF